MALKRKLVPQSVYRRQLAARLRELREAAGLTLTEVAEQIEVNQGSLSRIETGERGTTPVLVRALLDCYAVTDTDVRDDVLDLVRADKEQQKPWWRSTPRFSPPPATTATSPWKPAPPRWPTTSPYSFPDCSRPRTTLAPSSLRCVPTSLPTR
ncbi:helix-turn-helix domain-containing protein [Streptomyces sp. INA 01156]